MSWGDDKPILTSDNDETAKSKDAVAGDTFNMIGSVCSKCGGVDATHKSSCPNSN